MKFAPEAEVTAARRPAESVGEGELYQLFQAPRQGDGVMIGEV